MPNLNPVPDSVESLKAQLDIINRDAKIAVYPFGAITIGERGEEIADLEGMAKDVAGFSDDGRGVQSEKMMLEAMKRAKALGKIISAHCEDNSLLFGGYIHDGEYARAHGHAGICSESEWRPIKRDIELLKKSGAKYHVCHVSCKESVELIRRAKRDGVDITAETGPHYLVYDDSDLQEDGRFKMNPPLRSEEDKKALIRGVLDGTIDMIATDHAPHSAEEKSKGLKSSLMGVVGIETAFAAMYTHFVKTGIMPLEELIKIMSERPRERFAIESDAGLTVFDLSEEFTVNPDEFASMGRATPFEKERLFGKCLLTVYGGKAAYVDEKIK
jgi:dihydroorotase